MKYKLILTFVFGVVIILPWARAEDGLVPLFKLEQDDIKLERIARPQTYFDKVGSKFAILGFESGAFEAWAYPLKLFRNFEFSFLIGTSTTPIEGKDIAHFIEVTPAATTITFTYQSFTVKATYIAAIEDPGAIILLQVDTVEPLIVVCSFIPVLQPMWPAGIGGQYASWDDSLKAYFISEPTRKNHGFVGSPAARGISYTPAHMLSDAPNQFKIEIRNKDSVKGRFIPIIIAGGRGRPEDVKQIYERLASDPASYYLAAVNHYRELRAATLQIKTPVNDLDQALEWAKVALDNLVVENPDLGKGLVAGLGPSGMGGRPGFGWFFGGDAYFNSMSLNTLGLFSTAREALAFTQKWQRADGKMAHELSQAAGYLKWFEDYPYGYIHGDTTPFYLIAVDEYLRMSGDRDFVKRSWLSIKKAYDWCLTTDEDGDGLMDNKKAGLGALEYGSLTGIQTDVFLGAVWARAVYAMQHLAVAAGDRAMAEKAAAQFVRSRRAFDTKFWDSDSGQYIYAFNPDGKKVNELSPWAAVGLIWDLGDPGKSIRTLEKLGSADMMTDWGVRMLSTKSSLFEPLNYNYGAVWPFLTGWLATAQFKHNFLIQGYESLLSLVRHTYGNALGCVTELFSGTQNIWPEEAVPHQGFGSAGLVLSLVRGLLGLEGDSDEKRVVFEPRFPADWDRVSAENHKIGDEKFSFRWTRNGGKIRVEVSSSRNSGFSLGFAPVFGPGTKILGARWNGRPVPFKLATIPFSGAVQPLLEGRLKGNDLVELDIEPTVEILPSVTETKTGERNRGLKVIKTEMREKQLRLTLEGLSKETYRLAVTNPDLIISVQGARLDAGQLIIEFPDGGAGEFVGREVLISVR